MALNFSDFNAEIMLQQSLDAICRKSNGVKTIKVLHILSYFSSRNVPIDIFMTLMSKQELETSIEHLKQFLLIDSSNKSNFINVNKFVQKRVRTLLREEKKEVEILKEAAELLLRMSTNSEKFQFVFDHGICVWSHMHNYDELLKISCALPKYIVSSLIQQSKYKEANSFAWEALELLKNVADNNHIEVLRLEFEFARLLEISGKYKEAVRILIPLYVRTVTDEELKIGILRSLISVTKKLQDKLQYHEVLPIYEKLLSGQKVEDASNEYIINAWHNYAILLKKLGKYDDSINILKEILSQKGFPLKPENILSLKNSIINVYLEQMQYNKALDVYTELILVERSEIPEKNYIAILKTKRNIISVLQKLGKYKEATKMCEELVTEYEKVFDKNHPEIALIQVDLALSFYSQNEYKKAVEIFRDIHKTTTGITIKTTNKNSESMIMEKSSNVYCKRDFRVLNEGTMKKNKEELPKLVNVETMLLMVDNNIGQIYALIQGGLDINCKDDMGNTLLHYAAKSENLSVIRLLLKQGSFYNEKNKEGKTPSQLTNNNDIKIIFSLVNKLFDHVKSGDIEEVNKCIKQERSLVNAKHNTGYHPLHLATSNGHTSVLKVLLDAGANATYVSNKGNTPLHTAASKGFSRIAEILLETVKYDELDDFINAQTYGTGTTALHLAAKNKFWHIVKLMLRYGAVFSIKNEEGKTPLELSEDQTEDNVLKMIHELYQDAENGNLAIIQKLQSIILEEPSSIFNACNEQGCTLIQVLIMNNHVRIACESLQILKAPYELKPWESFEGKLKQTENLKYSAENQLHFSKLYIPMLQSIANPDIPDTNPIPWKTVKEGSYFLGNACSLVRSYQRYYPTTIYDVNILQIKNVLQELQFESEHISSGYTDEAYGGKVECFVSKGQGTKYYDLLHSKFNKDVRYFIGLIEVNIDIPTARFLQSVTVQLQSLYSKALFEATKNKKISDFEKYLKKNEAFVNLDVKGVTPLFYSVENGDIKITKVLLEYGADTTQKTVKGDTLLHLATSKRYKTIVELLLQYTPAPKLHEYINSRQCNGDTSLHIAAKNGNALIAKTLLQYGAKYCLKNNRGKTPLALAAKHHDISQLLQIIHKCFQHAQNKDPELNNILQTATADELKAIANAENEKGQNIFDIRAEERKHNKIISDKLWNTMDEYIVDKYRKINQHQPTLYITKRDEKLREASRLFFELSDLYKCRLQHMCRYYPFDLQAEDSHWNVLKEGSLYLYNVHRFIEECKLYPELANNRYLQEIIETFEQFEFDPKHISWGYGNETHDPKAKSFISLGKGAWYYEILSANDAHSIENLMHIVEYKIHKSIQYIVY